MTVTPDERELFSELAALQRRSSAARGRRLPPRPTLRSALCGCAVLLASAAVVVTYSYLAPDATRALTTRASEPAPRPVVPVRSRPVAAPRNHPLPAFVWVAARGATSYEFRLLRGDALVYRARTAAPRLVLPRTWTVGRQTRRLEAGAYRWDVRPLFGKRRGAIIVRARLNVAA